MSLRASSFEHCQDLFRRVVRPAYEQVGLPVELEPRVVRYLEWLTELAGPVRGKQLVDLGSGLSPFGPLAAAMGMRVTLVDDFGGWWMRGEGLAQTRALLECFSSQFEMQVVIQDYLVAPLPLKSHEVDMMTMLHTLEHCHHSPQPAFQEAWRALRPGGYLLLATPNAVNLRKRLHVPLGLSNLPPLDQWYHGGQPEFRGHVREPTLGELHQLLKWNAFEVVGSEGRNYLGRERCALPLVPGRLAEKLVDVTDRVLCRFPTLCSDLHVVGRKP